MKCPSCSNRLQQVRTKSATVDVCPSCKGIWFDAGELPDFAKTLAESEEISPQKTKLFTRREVRTLYDVKEKDKICPKCSKKLHRFNYSYDSNVFLDKCPGCEGIWTDGGEIKEIARYLKDDPKTMEVARAIAETFAESQEDALGAEKAGFWFLPRAIVPLSDDTPRERFPVVTVSIIAVSTLIFIMQLLIDPGRLAEMLDFIPDDVFTIDLAASMFSQGGAINFIWNMLFLWLFGDNVEDRLGRFWYFIFFIACGLFASLLCTIFTSNLSVSAMGISGAVSGVMGAYFVFYPAANVRIFAVYDVIEVPAVVCLGLWFLFQILSPFLFKSSAAVNSLCFAYVGGFVLGAVVAACTKKR